MALISGLTKLIEKELNGEYNPIACAEEVIYNGTINPNTTVELIIPRIGDLIQELTIKYSYPSHHGIAKAYIETVCDYEQPEKLWKKQWPLRIFKIPLTLNSKPITTFGESCDRELCITPVALHWAGDSMPVQTVDTGLKLICDYEVNLLRPYQVTKLVLVTDKSTPHGKHSVSIIANYIFVDIESRRKLFF